ncbi:MAG: glycosyltransferase family 2 protein [Patescibacteria group bacterium]
MISGVILAKNEEKNIAKAITSLSFCDEIVVIDNDSTDRTIEVAKKHKASVLKNNSTDFSELRNFGLKEARGEWILFLDADELVSEELKTNIVNEIKNQSNLSYYIKRRDHFWGRELKFGEIKKARTKGIIRLVKKDSGNWTGSVHEVFVPHDSSGTLEGYIEHYPHQTYAEFLSEINTYSTLRAKELQKQGTRFSIFQLLFLPPAKFFYTYVLLLGFLDGPAGFAYAFTMSFHSFLVRAKLYQYAHLKT